MDKNVSNQLEATVESTLIKIGGRLIYVAYGMLLIAVVGAFGLGVWVTEIDSKIGGVSLELVRMREAIVDLKSGIPPKWLLHDFEDMKLDYHRLREELKRQQTQIDRIENTVWPAGGKPPLPPYAE